MNPVGPFHAALDNFASRIADTLNGFGAENTAKRDEARAAVVAEYERVREALVESRITMHRISAEMQNVAPHGSRARWARELREAAALGATEMTDAELIRELRDRAQDWPKGYSGLITRAAAALSRAAGEIEQWRQAARDMDIARGKMLDRAVAAESLAQQQAATIEALRIALQSIAHTALPVHERARQVANTALAARPDTANGESHD